MKTPTYQSRKFTQSFGNIFTRADATKYIVKSQPVTQQSQLAEANAVNCLFCGKTQNFSEPKIYLTLFIRFF